MNASQDPASQLKLLSALADAKEVGKERIGGEQTTHYHGELDYNQVAKSGPQELRKAAELALKVMAKTTIPSTSGSTTPAASAGSGSSSTPRRSPARRPRSRR